MKTKYKLPAIAATAVMASPIAVHATTIVDFSFTGSSGKTVTGSLSFASTNGTGLKPTDVKILTAPTPFHVPADLGKGTFTYGPGYTFGNGNIKNGSFYIQGDSSGGWMNILSLNGNNELRQSVTANAQTSNSRGFSGVQYTTASSTSVPEPASIALLGAGIAGIATFRRRRRTPRS